MSVIVYTKPNCVQCNMTKKRLEDRGIPYATVDITQDPDALDKLISQGFQAAPVVNVGDRWWAGFQPDEIDSIQVLTFIPMNERIGI